MKKIRWILGTIGLVAAVVLIMLRPIPFLFFHDLPMVDYFGRALYIMVLMTALCFYRIFRGPASENRIVATDILGIVIVGLCALLTITTQRSWYVDIAIAWALQSFISTLALAKYLDGKGFDE